MSSSLIYIHISHDLFAEEDHKSTYTPMILTHTDELNQFNSVNCFDQVRHYLALV